MKVSYGTDGQKIFIHYIVDFHETKFSDGSSLGATCRITFEIDNHTFVKPDAVKVPVSNKQYDSLFRNLPTYDAQQVLQATLIAVVVISGLALGGVIATKLGITSFVLLLN